MLSQSDETIAAWKATERTLAVRVTIAGKEYTATDINSLKYDAGAYTGETFAIGSTYSNNIQIEFSHLVEGLKLGDIVEVSIGIKVSNKYIYDPLGVFVISSEIKMDRNNNLTTISASDAFCKLEGVYKSKLTYPAKVLDVISEICAMAGVDPNTSELSRLPKLADIPTAVEGQSYRKTLGWIAQLYAGYATFDRSGKLTIRTVVEPSYELDPSQYEQGGLTKNEAIYKIGGIQCQVTTKSTTRDDQAQETTTTLQVGSTSGAQIKLENNVMTQERLDYIWEQLKDINFYPFSLNWFGNPAVEAGDWLRLYDKKGNDFVVPNNGYTLEFNGGLSAVSKADQTSGSSQVVSWTGGLMQTIRELQHRNSPDGTVIFPTSVTEPPKDAHINDVWFKKNGNSTELWIFERQSDGTGEWQRKDIVNDEIKAEIEKQQAELEKLSKNVDDSTESFQQSLSGIYDAVGNAKINTDKAVQQALDQAQKVSNDLLDYASGFDSEINLLNEAKDKNKADINKLLADVNGVKGMYADLEGNISNFNAGLNGLSGQLKDTNNQLASVKLTADGAVSNFVNLQGDIASLKTRANGIEQQMLSKVGSDVFETFKSSTARELKEKLTATDLNGYVKTAELERTANGLHASVTAVEGKINNLNIGGRNYLQGTADFSWAGGIGENGALKKTIENYTDNIKMLHISSDIFSGIYTKWGQAFPNEQLQVGDDYTFSFDAKGRGIIGVVKNESESGNPLSGTSLTNEWQRFCVSGKINALNKAFIIYFSGGYDAYIKCVQVEKGNKPTDWSPAPEDINNEFTTVNNTLKANKVTLDVLQNGISLNAVETSKINDKISNLGIQNLVYNSEFINNAEGWSNIGDNPAGTILFANNEWDSWKGSNGLAFRNPSKQDYLVSDNKRFKVVSGQRLSASVQLHVTDTMTHGQCRAGLEIKFYANERDPEIATSNQQTQFMYNIENGQQKLLYCENVEVPSNAKYAAIRLYTFGVGNIIFNQPMVTFSSTRLPYIKDTHMIRSLQDKYAALDVKVNGINATVVNKADLSYVDQKASQLQLALTSLQIGGTNLLKDTSKDVQSVGVPTTGWLEGLRYDTTKALNKTRYTLSFEAKALLNGQKMCSYFWHGDLGGVNRVRGVIEADGVERDNPVDGFWEVSLTNNWKKYYITYKFDPDDTRKSVIVGRRFANSSPTPAGSIYIKNVKLEEGVKATDWSPAPEDDMAAITAVRNELNTAIDLRVQKNELLSQINLQAGRTLIQSNKIYLDAESVVFSGKAFIPSAAIASLSADKINGGTINGRTVNVTNLNANNITSGTINGQNLSINLDNGLVQFQRGKITKADNSFTIDINTGEISSSDTTGAKLYVNKGALSTVDKDDEGIFLRDGSLELTSKNAFFFDKSELTKYGKISKNGNIFEDNYGGIDILGNKGFSLRTQEFSVASRILFGAEQFETSGSGMVGGKGRLSLAAEKTVLLYGGKPFSLNNITRRPQIAIGTFNRMAMVPDVNNTQNVYIEGEGIDMSAKTIGISSYEDVGIYTANYWSLSSKTIDGAGFMMKATGEVELKSGGPLQLTAGDPYNTSIMSADRPTISIGSDTWNGRGHDYNRGQNVSISGNGVYIHPLGETMIGNGGLTVLGRLGVQGAKNSIVDTSQGKTAINAYETAEYYFGDIAKVNTGTSKRVKIMIDPLFLETINTDIDYHVFVSSYGNGYAWVSEMSQDYFVIESNVPNLSVSYEIKAKRRNYENVRLDTVDVK